MRRKILVIEDDRDLRMLLKLTLEFTGRHDVLLAENGVKGLELARNVLPNVILLDVGLPGMDGFETLRRLQDCTETQNIPVVFLTGKTERKEMQHALSIGAIGYLTKPFDAMKLNDQLETLLNHVSPSP